MLQLRLFQLTKDPPMNDFYLKFAHTSLGNSLFQALNLPQPMQLDRSPHDSMAKATGRFLVAAAPNSFAIKNTLKLLSTEASELHYYARDKARFHPLPTTLTGTNDIYQVDELDESRAYDGLVFDATGIDGTEKLSSLYGFFHDTVKALKNNKKIVILAQEPIQLDEPIAFALQASVIGFCKSLAKELGKKGICCNVIFIQKGAEKYLETSLAFFLSNKSSFISGQYVNLRSQTLKLSTSTAVAPLSGKTALVTGAAQGIGKETAITLARDGAKVICLDIPQNEHKLEILADEIGGMPLAINLLAENAVTQVVENIATLSGKIDIVVHNAGITRDKTLAKMSHDLWNQVLTLNFERIVTLNQAFLERNIFHDHARIICISSISGIAGNFGQTNYACSKAAIAAYVEAFAKSTALKGNSGLTINAIAPGFIETQMTGQIPLLTREVGRRMNALSQGGLPLDIAEAVSFFANPGSHSLSGNVLRVCGLSLLGR